MDVLRMIDVGSKLTVQKVAENGDATMTMTYDAVYFMEKSPAMTIEYDSSQPRPVSPLARYLSAVVGQSVTVTLSPQGKVVEMLNVSEMLEHLKTEQAKTNLPAATQASITKSIEQAFGEATLKASLESITDFYPQSPMKVGEAWTDKRVVSLGTGRMNHEQSFTLVSRQKGRSKIQATGTSSIDPDSGGLQIGLAGTCKDGQGSSTTTIEVDEATGWPISSNSEDVLSGSLEPPATARAGTPTLGMTIKSRSRVSVT